MRFTRLLPLLPLALLSLGAALVLGPGLPGQVDADKALAVFGKAFRQTKKPPAPAVRLTAIAGLQGCDSLQVAKALVKAHAVLDAERDDLESRRAALQDKMTNLLGGRAATNIRSPDFRAAEQAAGALRDALDELREVLGALGLRIGELRDREGVAWLIKTVCGSRKYTLSLKIRAARTGGTVGVAVLPELTAALEKSKVAAEIAAVLDGIGIMAKAAQPAAPRIIALLQHKEPIVQEHAALALSHICEPAAIEPMIDLLAVSYGQTKKRVAAYLEALARQQHGTSASTWKRWWAVERDKYLSGSMPLGGGAPSHKKETEKRYASYFGIPQDGKSIVYIIDSSGSMAQPIRLRLPRTDPPDSGKGGRTKAKMRKEKDGSGGTDPQQTTRLEACKAELIRALDQLEPTTMFNVVWYSDMPHQYKPKMLRAEAREIREAQAWVRRLQPNSSTNIHDSLQMAFRLTGLLPDGGRRGPITGPKQGSTNPDTIFLLTDGTPTLPPGNRIDSTEKIILAVREWNALKSVVIHTIGIGNGVNVPFLAQLARENGGEFKQY